MPYVNDKNYLNLPQQVEKNKEDIILLEQKYDELIKELENVDVTIVNSIPLDVNIQDQTSPAVISKMSLLKFEGNITSQAIKETNSVFVALTDISNFSVGDLITIFNTSENRFYQGRALTVTSGTGEIILDTSFDFTYPIGSYITSATSNLAVNGSLSSPIIFGLRNTINRIEAKFDITRLIFTCTTSSALDLSKFADIVGGITNGIVLRRNDGVITNYFNVKTNKDIASLMYDFTIIAATNPQQGVDGFIGRLTFAGQSKIGVTIRLENNDDLQLLVQDDLTSITLFEITVEGHIVVD